MVAKLTDVAKLAGVSPTTVSRVINKKGYLSEKTIQKVNEAMRELGYKPNNLARSLQGKSAKLIGLIFPNISNVFYAELIDKLEHQLFKNGYKTIICNSEHDSEKEREYIEMLEANQVDGIISGSHNLGIEDYNRVTAPIISFDRNLSPDIPVVSSDNYAGGVLAAQTLVKTGAQSIIMILEMTILIRPLDCATLVFHPYSQKLLLSIFPVTFLLSEKKWKSRIS